MEITAESNKQIWKNNEAIQRNSKDITQLKERQRSTCKKIEELEKIEQRVESLEVEQRLTNDKVIRVCTSVDNLANELKQQQQQDHEYKIKKMDLEKQEAKEKRDWLFRTVLALIIAAALSSLVSKVL